MEADRARVVVCSAGVDGRGAHSSAWTLHRRSCSAHRIVGKDLSAAEMNLHPQ